MQERPKNQEEINCGKDRLMISQVAKNKKVWAR